MTMRNVLKPFLGIAAALLLVGQGCVQVKSGPKTADGGVFRSSDKGVTWTQKAAIASVGQARSMAGMNITALALDPSDRKAVYAGTPDVGLFFSYDGAESWQHAASLGRVPVNDVDVLPNDKCTVFVATGNRVARTNDCARTWENAYFDARADARVTRVAIDQYNPAVIYAANSKGDLLKSSDGGASWSTIRRFESEIAQLLLTAADSRVIYVVTKTKGLWKSTDAGANWTDLSKSFGDFKGALDRMLIAEDPATANALVAASQFGLLRSTDGGATWKAIPILTPPGGTVIHSLAVSPKDSNAIFYGTATALFRTVDGGAKWVTSKLPTSRAATSLLIDPTADGTMYMGTTLFEQKTGF